MVNKGVCFEYLPLCVAGFGMDEMGSKERYSAILHDPPPRTFLYYSLSDDHAANTRKLVLVLNQKESKTRFRISTVL